MHPTHPPAGPPESSSGRADPSKLLETLLGCMDQVDGSDMHLSAGEPVRYRIHGNLSIVPEWKDQILNSNAIQTLAMHAIADDRDDRGEIMITDVEKRKQRLQVMQQRFEKEMRLDFAYGSPKHGRFRVNLFLQRRGAGAVFRRIPNKIPTVDDLGLPSAMRRLATLNKGLVLLCGPTGSGKSTTLAAIIDLINASRKVNILTIEDPIEFVHMPKHALISQREIGVHTPSFKQALRDGLRQDPDVILVGEMRDLETIELAMTAAETGHLVFGTLHANSSVKAIDRIIDVFPADQQNQIRTQLSTTMQAIITQQLLPSSVGRGRIAAHEILLTRPAVMANIREGRLEQIATTLQTGAKEGMQSMDKALISLARAKKISIETAIAYAEKQADVTRELRASPSIFPDA